MSVATLARKLGLALPNLSMRKMFGVMAGVWKHRTGLGKGDRSQREDRFGRSQTAAEEHP